VLQLATLAVLWTPNSWEAGEVGPGESLPEQAKHHNIQQLVQ
jgi:hypothetical protein